MIRHRIYGKGEKMRIVGGTAKGRRLKSRKGNETRPTLERVKESLFGIISPYVSGSKFLDLYSGTGNIALEALSRGASRAVMIEKEKEALRIIIENINDLGFEGISRAYLNDTLRAIEILGKKHEKFDIIFMDPPYKDEICVETIKAIEKAGILDGNGLIICEHHIAEKMPEELCGYKKADERTYSIKVMTFYTKA